VDLTEDHFTDGNVGIVEIIYLCLKICSPTSNLLAHCSLYAPISLTCFVSIKKKRLMLFTEIVCVYRLL